MNAPVQSSADLPRVAGRPVGIFVANGGGRRLGVQAGWVMRLVLTPPAWVGKDKGTNDVDSSTCTDGVSVKLCSVACLQSTREDMLCPAS